MLFLSTISNGLEIWSVNHTVSYEKSELKTFKNMTVLGKISSNWPKYLLEINA